MILVALAAAAAALPPGSQTMTLPMPNLYHQPSYCRQVVQQEIERQTVAFHGQRPAVEYAVVRMIAGCGVPTPVGYHPGAQSGVADAPAAKPEDAPSNRR